MSKEMTGTVSGLWRCHTPALLNEVLCNPHTQAVEMPLKIFSSILYEVAMRAQEIDDPELNALMLRLTLYENADPYIPGHDAEAIGEYIDAHSKKRQSTGRSVKCKTPYVRCPDCEHFVGKSDRIKVDLCLQDKFPCAVANMRLKINTKGETGDQVCEMAEIEKAKRSLIGDIALAMEAQRHPDEDIGYLEHIGFVENADVAVSAILSKYPKFVELLNHEHCK